MLVKRLISRLFAVLKGISCNIAYCLSGFFPRNKNIWLFGAWEGSRYCDNAKYFFEYALKNANGCPKQVSWLTHKDKVVKLLESKGYPVLLSKSWKAWRYNLRAGVIFVTHGRHDVISFLSRGAVVINLNHALPIKHMGYDVKNDPYYHPSSLLRKWLFKIIDPYWNLKFDYSLSPSQKTAWIVRSSLQAPEDRVLSFGFPRFAPLASPPDPGDRERLARALGCAAGSRWILYMPTFRDAPGFSHFHYGFDPDRLEKLLMESKAEFLLALHPFDSSNTPQKIKDGRNSNVRSISPMDVNELLPHIGVLVTDYSSVMFDYLLLDRPIIYTQFDFEDFTSKQRGLYFDYSEVTAGRKAKNWDEVADGLSEILLGGKDPYASERHRVRKMLFDEDYSRANEKILRHLGALT